MWYSPDPAAQIAPVMLIVRLPGAAILPRYSFASGRTGAIAGPPIA